MHVQSQVYTRLDISFTTEMLDRYQSYIRIKY